MRRCKEFWWWNEEIAALVKEKCQSEHWRLKSILGKRHLANVKNVSDSARPADRGAGMEENYRTFTLHAEGDKNETGGRQSHVRQ